MPRNREEMKSHGAPIRLRDVAAAAEVHSSTASRVLNGVLPSKVSEETRERILAVAEELGYRPNAAARALRIARAGAVGFVVPSLRNPVYADITRGAFERARESGLVVLLTEDSAGTFEASGFPALISEGRIDGLVIGNAHLGTAFALDAALAGTGLPYVFVNRGSAGSQRNVTMDEAAAGRLAAEHLIESGHRRLALLAGPSDLDTARRRGEGFLGAAADAGLDVDVVHAEFDESDAYERVGELIDRRPTGMFVSNINQAIGALARIRSTHLRVPADLSIVACDDDPFTEFLEVPLTVIRMPLRELGMAAIDSLVSQLEGGEPVDVQVPDQPVLVERASSAPIRDG